MPDNCAEQIANLKQSIATLEDQQRTSGIDQSAAIQHQRELLAQLESTVTAAARLDGSGAIAQGDHAKAAGERSVVADNIHGLVNTGDHNTIIYQGELVSIPSAEAVKAHRAALRDKLETEAQSRWGGMGTYISEEGSRLPIEASPYQPGLSGQREDLLKRLLNADRLIVLGEPGSGKTVALQRFAWEACSDDKQPIVPVLVPLLFFGGAPLDDWLRACLQETSHLRLDNQAALVAFLKEGQTRCCFLFDGLNEVKPAHRDQLQDQLVRWMVSYPEHAVIITSRVQDEQWRALRQRVSDTLVIQAITGPQIQTYLAAHLGSEKGQALFDRLDARLRTLAQRPLLLYLMKEAALHGESLPGNRGELYARFVARLLSRDTGERGLETRLADRIKHQAAAHLAFKMHRRATLTCTRDEAVAIVAVQPEQSVSSEEIITALLRHGLLIGDEQLRFPHQTLQEYFAAEALRAIAEHERNLRGPRRIWQSAQTAFTGKSQGLGALAKDDWWNEAIIQLAGLLEDPAWLARTVARVNPWLAWWCVAEGRTVDADTRTIIESRSIKLLKSEKISNRLRSVQALSKIQSERTFEPLLQAAEDEDAEINELALSALIQMGEVARVRLLAQLRQEATDSSRATIRYATRLVATGDQEAAEAVTPILPSLVGQPVVYVPPGPFLMGSATTDTTADDDERPQHTVALPGYWIGRYPITTVLFREFIQASQYSQSKSSSLKGQDNHPVVCINLDDALAYCRWLSKQTGLHIMLPSEAEWEKAARGADGRLYPWGNESPNASRCNFNYHEKVTTSVGQYSPRGDSPYGCADMAGNVLEWTRSVFKPYPYDPNDGRENLQSTGYQVLRGGAFLSYKGVARCAYRDNYVPYDRDYLIGFRVVVAPF